MRRSITVRSMRDTCICEHAEQIADLALREVLLEPEPQQLPVAVVEVGFELGEEHTRIAGAVVAQRSVDAFAGDRGSSSESAL